MIELALKMKFESWLYTRYIEKQRCTDHVSFLIQFIIKYLRVICTITKLYNIFIASFIYYIDFINVKWNIVSKISFCKIFIQFHKFTSYSDILWIRVRSFRLWRKSLNNALFKLKFNIKINILKSRNTFTVTLNYAWNWHYEQDSIGRFRLF